MIYQSSIFYMKKRILEKEKEISEMIIELKYVSLLYT
jgi:hypothetical protein